MSLDIFMNDTCPMCRRPTKLSVVEQHPTRRELSVHRFECTNCGDVKTKNPLQKVEVTA